MARTNNLINFLTDVADAIREKKGTEEEIFPANFDTEISNISTMIGEEITITPSTSEQVITPSQGKNAITQATVSAVTSSIDSDIKAENIKKGISILNVTGAYDKSKIILQITDAEVNNSTLVIQDRVGPIITITGQTSVSVDFMGSYTDAGATAMDDRDGDITDRIVTTIKRDGVIVSSLDTEQPGVYSVIYSVSDSAGNTSSATRTVTVNDPTALKYIESTGTQYIDVGNLGSSNHLILRCKLSLTNVTSNNPVWGFINNSANTASYLRALSSGTYQYYNKAGNYNVINLNSVSTSNLDIITYENNYEPSITNFNGTVLGSVGGQICQPANGNVHTYLFAINNNGTPNMGRCKIYYCQVYEAGTLVRDFIPVRDANNVLCMYDKVTHTFFYNQGTGEFLPENAAPVITVLGETNIQLEYDADPYVDAGATAMDDRDGDITNNIETTITYNGTTVQEIDTTQPGVYTITYSVRDSSYNLSTAKRTVTVDIDWSTVKKLEYIQATGSQSINTLYQPTNNSTVEIKISNMTNGTVQGVLDANTSWNDGTYLLYRLSAGEAYWTYTNKQQIISAANMVNVNVINLYRGRAIVNGVTVKNDTTAYNRVNTNLWIFSSPNLNNYAKGYLYYFKLWESGVLKRDMIPIERISDGKIGMFDNVNKVFYFSQGSSDFIAGPEIQE